MPQPGEAERLIALFSETVGATLSYVNQPAILEILDRTRENVGVFSSPRARAAKALLAMVFAHAVSTRDAAGAESYYRHALCLLDPKTLYAPSLELCRLPWLFGMW